MNMNNFSKIESKWRKIWDKAGVYEPDLKKAKKPFYNLMMFPYPSAEGLHVGNAYAFIGSDIYGRFNRMSGYDVFEPIGLDGFGIHSENYALKVGTHPAKQAKVSEKRFYKQLQSIGNGFAWKERVETYNPNYYKWTQWIFVEMWKRGLAYRKKQAVNWCPGCMTVLADEQVIDGECERCSNKVQKKELEQWFLRITDYAEKLLGNLDKLDWAEKVKIAQRNWIGKSSGSLIHFKIRNSKQKVSVFTTRPDTLMGVTYLVMSPEHELIDELKSEIQNFEEVQNYINEAKAKSDEDRTAMDKEKTGVELKGIRAINPVSDELVPIWISDYVLSGYGTGAIMAVPAHDQRDYDFAKKFGLPIKRVIAAVDENSKIQLEQLEENKAFEGDGILINSGKFNGMMSVEAGKEITKFAGGKLKSQYRLRDWLISRQRYWGPPIPMIFCESCASAGKGEHKDMHGWYAVPQKDLPVKLPFIKDFKPKGKGSSPLADVKSFYKTKCPECGGVARRETDVSDTFLDSAWYFLRYPSVKETKKVFDKTITKKWLPVHRYTGGAEHAVLHLLYSRFITMVLNDDGLIPFDEPFKSFRVNGLLIKEGKKMSKSKGNVVNPDEYIAKFGADTLRLYLMFLGPFEDGGDWHDAGIMGIVRFINRVWKMGEQELSDGKTISPSLHASIKKITEDISSLHYNTVISELMIMLNGFERQEKVSKADFKVLLTLIAPFAPFISEELYQKIAGTKGKFKSVHLEKWPKYNPELVQKSEFELIIQVNGKVRGKVIVASGIKESEAKEIALKNPAVAGYVTGNEIKKIIFVPNRLINLVI
jgi:leucyl-tRNA synthetase